MDQESVDDAAVAGEGCETFTGDQIPDVHLAVERAAHAREVHRVLLRVSRLGFYRGRDEVSDAT